MMKNKKGVVGIYFIVTAAIAFIILVVMIVFIKTGAGGSISRITDLQKDTFSDLETERFKCQSLCNQAKAIKYDLVAQWQASGYCRKTSNIDLDGDEEIEDGERRLNCWNSTAIYVLCDSKLKTGAALSYCACDDEICCDIGCTGGELDCSTVPIGDCDLCTGTVGGACWDPVALVCDVNKPGCSPTKEMMCNEYDQAGCTWPGECSWDQQSWDVNREECV